MRWQAVFVAIAVVALSPSACSSGGGDSTANDDLAIDTTASTRTPSTSTSPPTSRPPTYPSGDPLVPGYPLIVPIETIDNRVASWLEDSVNEAGEVVALAPGVYAPFNALVPDLADYLDGPVDGDCTVRDAYFPQTGGVCWSGVQAGSAEPAA